LRQNLLREASFFLLLVGYDRDLAEQVRSRRCPHCGSRLQFGRHWRKPRGGRPGLPSEHERLASLCSSAEGCGKRALPPSLRFFGRHAFIWGRCLY
jgi:hypothetical protein